MCLPANIHTCIHIITHHNITTCKYSMCTKFPSSSNPAQHVSPKSYFGSFYKMHKLNLSLSLDFLRRLYLNSEVEEMNVLLNRTNYMSVCDVCSTNTFLCIYS